MLRWELFRELDVEYGPCTVDCCCDPQGSNSHCSKFYSSANSFLDNSVTGECCFLNPPFRYIRKFLQHYLDCKAKSPNTTSAIIIVPLDHTAEWWTLLTGMQVVRFWATGSKLFSQPGYAGRLKRRLAKGCPFPVIALFDAPVRAYTVRTGIGRFPDFIMDSGATHHITGTLAILHNFQHIVEGSGILPSKCIVADGTALKVLGYGTVILRKGGSTVVIDRVLYVPGIHSNLLSVRTFLDSGSTLYGVKGYLYIQKDGEIVLTAPNKASAGKLYVVDHKPVVNVGVKQAIEAGARVLKTQILKNTVKPISAKIWHQRMAHMGYSSLKPLSTMVEGLHVNFDSQEEVCEICTLCKQTRHPRFASTSERAARYLYRIHTDLCGPIEVQSIRGKKYILLATDEYSGFSLYRLLRSKGEVVTKLPEILDEFERDTVLKVQNLRTDNGGEFTKVPSRIILLPETFILSQPHLTLLKVMV